MTKVENQFLFKFNYQLSLTRILSFIFFYVPNAFHDWLLLWSCRLMKFLLTSSITYNYPLYSHSGNRKSMKTIIRQNNDSILRWQCLLYTPNNTHRNLYITLFIYVTLRYWYHYFYYCCLFTDVWQCYFVHLANKNNIIPYKKILYFLCIYAYTTPFPVVYMLSFLSTYHHHHPHHHPFFLFISLLTFFPFWADGLNDDGFRNKHETGFSQGCDWYHLLLRMEEYHLLLSFLRRYVKNIPTLIYHLISIKNI